MALAGLMMAATAQADPVALGVPSGPNGPQSGWVPSGYAASIDKDGLSFARGAGLERSARFLDGAGPINAGARARRPDFLMSWGVGGAAGGLKVRFGPPDRFGGPPFGGRAKPEDPIATPEPASMLLIGTGLAGLAAARHRRARKLAKA